MKRAVNEKREDEWICQSLTKARRRELEAGRRWKSHLLPLSSPVLHRPASRLYGYAFTIIKESGYFIHSIFCSNFLHNILQQQQESFHILMTYFTSVQHDNPFSKCKDIPQEGTWLQYLVMSSHAKSSALQRSTRCFVFGCHLVDDCLIMLNFRSKGRVHRSDAGSSSFNDHLLSKLFVTDSKCRLLYR